MSVAQGPWQGGYQKKPRAIEPFVSFSPSEWEGVDPPPYDWMVDGCFMRGTVAMVSGDGGLGKTLLLHQLQTAAAIGKPWLGLDTEQCNTIGFYCEDDKGELHRRQSKINAFYGCDYGDLTPMMIVSRPGMENVLMEFDRREDTPKPTPLFEQLRTAILSHEAKIAMLDTVADVFGGNEIIKVQVRRFITALRRVAIEMGGCIILSAHPSVAGMSSGTGNSGNVAWNNSVRCRLYLTRARPEDEEDGDTNRRFLRTMKNNQGPFGGKVALRWKDGVFVRDDHGSSPSNIVDKIDMDSRLLDALRRLVGNGTLVAADHAARTGFANVLRQVPGCSEYGWGAVSTAQERMLHQGKIVKVEMGPPSKRRIFVRPIDMRYPGEDAGETQ